MIKSDTIKYSRKTNRLINEKSPYLLQHAHNSGSCFYSTRSFAWSLN
ncbi:thioredoxin domain-containing protein [Clostridium estertheticum]|nr:thioredoxin domain-containing protein [Clostridium estertheticum]MCB2360388.1 thioredoxin domain-containing protein [Clostridium estertheticum]